MGALRIKRDQPLDEQIKDTRQQIDNGKTIGVEFLLTFGANNAAQYEDYYKLMHDAAAYAQERGLKVVLKPHGGASGASEEILRCLDKMKHPNFKVWFDAGNIVFYTGKDPVEELKPIAEQVTGFCAKDCTGQKGSVTLQFGTGKVDFRAVFSVLKAGRLPRPVHGRVLRAGRHAGDRHRQRAPEPRVPGEGLRDAVACVGARVAFTQESSADQEG